MNRRNFIATLSALGSTLFSPVLGLLGFSTNRPKLIINGIELDLPDELDIKLEIPKLGYNIGPIKLLVTNGILKIENNIGPTLHILSKNNGSIHFIGDPAVLIENKSEDMNSYSIRFTNSSFLGSLVDSTVECNG